MMSFNDCPVPGYQQDMINVLRRQRPKLEDEQEGIEDDTEFQDDRELFDVHLRKLLYRDGVEDADIELLCSETAKSLQEKLQELCQLLNTIVNDEIQCPKDTIIVSDIPFRAAGDCKRLEKMLCLVDRSQGPFQLATGSKYSLFKFDTPAAARNARILVRNFNRFLNGIDQDFLESSYISTKKQTANHVLAHAMDFRYRANIGTILDSLYREFPECEARGQVDSHMVLVQLSDYETMRQSVSSLSLDLFLFCPIPKQWHNTLCRFKQNTTIYPRSRMPLCRLLKFYNQRADGLMLVFNHAQPAFTDQIKELSPPNQKPSIKLFHLIHKLNAFDLPSRKNLSQDIFNHSERRTLAAKLALNLLTFCAWQHSSMSWDDNEIFFLASSSTHYEKARSYIKCFLGRESSPDTQVESAHVDPVPSFTRFAKLLLELEYGPLPTGDFSEKNNYGYTLVKAFYQDKKNYGDQSRTSYLKAVQACLQFDRLHEKERCKFLGRSETEDETRRRIIRTYIVENIMYDLDPPVQQRLKHPRQMSPDFNSKYDHKFKILENAGRQRKSTMNPAMEPISFESFHEKAPPDITDGQRSEPRITIDRFSSKVHQEVRQNPGEHGELMLKRPATTTSATWFREFDRLDGFLTASTEETDRNYEQNRVKVAVIDSGLGEDRLNDAYITYRNFIPDEKRNSAFRDDPQHGTDSVDLIRKIYGRAHIYVAKVFQATKADENTSTYMANAVQWAIEQEVNIISISAGFHGGEYRYLKRQIELATAGGDKPEILVFAAASNSQDINGIAFPASMKDRVFCIFCCNGGLAPSIHWNPSARECAFNFAMLGENVELYSGRTLAGGTSISTALAAGLAAKLLDFCRQPQVRSWTTSLERKIQTKSGMSEIFMAMVSKGGVRNDGYQYLKPWEILPDWKTQDRCNTRRGICTIMGKAVQHV